MASGRGAAMKRTGAGNGVRECNPGPELPLWLVLALGLASCSTAAPTTSGPPLGSAAKGTAPPLLEAPEPPAAKPLPPPDPVLSRAVLGDSPGPFAELKVLRPGMNVGEMKKVMPAARNEAPNELGVDLVGLNLHARIRSTEHGIFDWIAIDAWSGAEEQLTAAWGAPTKSDEGSYWLSNDGWRADIGPVSGEGLRSQLTIGHYVAFSTLLGRGPDGLWLDKTLIGETADGLRARFPNELTVFTPADPSAWDKVLLGEGDSVYHLSWPATEVCRYFTTVRMLWSSSGTVSGVEVRQCVANDETRSAVRTALKRAHPTGNWPDDDSGFALFSNRRLDASLDDSQYWAIGIREVVK